MADGIPQLEDGFTRFANELLEAFCRTRIAGQAYQVVLCVARKTYGYGKKYDHISYGQISDMTGISRHKIVPIVRALSEMKILCVTNNGNTKPITIGINKHFPEWSTVPKKGVPNNGVPNNRNTSVPNNGTKGVPNNGTHKRKKEKKDIPDIFLSFSKNFHDHRMKSFPTRVKEVTQSQIKKGATTVMALVNKGYDFEQQIRPALRWGVTDTAFWSEQLLSLCGLTKKSERNGQMKFVNLLAAFERDTAKKDDQPKTMEALLPL